MLLTPIHLAGHGGYEFGPVGRLTLAEPVCLNLLIQSFIEVQFQAVARHLSQPQPRRVGGSKTCSCSGFVHLMPVQDQIDCADDLFE
ncbi:MAG: hypothetical protein JW384_04333 [Nitrosomonadaceae bacterium]|nr:hypothetical protein [Nitrosomonadaceae bacterium]